MTLTSTDLVKIYTGDGSNDPLSYPYKFYSNSDLVVTQITIATGAEVTLTLDTHYSVTGAGLEAGGSVTPINGSVDFASTFTWSIKRKPPLKQLLDLTFQEKIDTSAVEQGLDLLVMMMQDLNEQLSRFLALSIASSGVSGTLPTPVANNLLGWAADGLSIENKVAADIDLATVSAFVGTLLNDTDAATFRTSIGAEAADASILKSDVAATLTKGYKVTTHDLGNSGTGTVTPNFDNGNAQEMTVNGNHTLAAPTGEGIMRLEITTDATGGYTQTLSGFDLVVGSYSGNANETQQAEIDTTGSKKILTYGTVGSAP